MKNLFVFCIILLGLSSCNMFTPLYEAGITKVEYYKGGNFDSVEFTIFVQNNTSERIQSMKLYYTVHKGSYSQKFVCNDTYFTLAPDPNYGEGDRSWFAYYETDNPDSADSDFKKLSVWAIDGITIDKVALWKDSGLDEVHLGSYFSNEDLNKVTEVKN